MSTIINSIKSGIESAVTPAGTNARAGQVADQGAAVGGAKDALNWLGPLQGTQAKFSSGLEPARESAIQNALYTASPGNDQARQNLFATQAASNAGLAAKETGATEAGQGFSDAYAAGNKAALANQAAQATNQNWQQMNDPAYHLKQAEALANLYQTSQGMPSQSAYSNAVNTVYGQPQVPVAPGFGQVLGNIAGSYLGNL